MYGKITSLRPVIVEDSKHYFRWINNKELVLLNSNFKPVTYSDHQKWFNSINLNKDQIVFSIVETQTNKLIGSCSLRNINSEHNNAELQIRIGEPDYHNRGFGSDAVRQLVSYGFESLQLKRIYLYVFNHNRRAIKAYKKCNFEIEGLLKKAALINNEYIDLLLMSTINFKE